MSQYPNTPSLEPWQYDTPTRSPAQTAAMLLWILAAVQTVFFGCASMGLGLLAVMPLDELLNQIQTQGQQIDTEVFKQVHSMAGALAVMLFVITCIPAVVYAIMAYFIRKQNQICMVIATVLLVIQTAVLGLMLLSSLLEGIMTVNVPALLMGLLIFGIPVGLQVAVLYHLYQFKTGNSKAFASDWNAREPWE